MKSLKKKKSISLRRHAQMSVKQAAFTADPDTRVQTAVLLGFGKAECRDLGSIENAGIATR